MRVLPKEHWGAVINRYQDFYGNRQDYTRQLRTMEKGLHDRPKDPVRHCLAGYHYGYQGFHKQSVEQLEATVHIEPRDELARQLLDEMKNKLFKHEALPPVPAPTPAKDI